MNSHACLFVCFFAKVWDSGTKNGVVHCTKNQWKNAWKFLKSPEKMLGSFGSQIGSQNATDIGRNVPWTSQPTVPGGARKKFWLGLPKSTMQYESHLLSINAEHPQIS